MPSKKLAGRWTKKDERGEQAESGSTKIEEEAVNLLRGPTRGV